MARTSLTSDHHKQRIEQLNKVLEQKEIKTYFVFNSHNIFYLTGFSFIPTERPLALIINDGMVSFFVPSLEVEHVQAQVPFLSNIYSYFDYPSDIHPMEQLATAINNEMKISNNSIASEYPGAPGYWGYTGPKLEKVLKSSIKILPELVMDLRVIKSIAEVDLLKESSKWAEKAHKYLQDYTSEGENEIDVSIRASKDTSEEMQTTLGKDYYLRGWTMFPAVAGYRGQIGSYSAFPHALTQGFTFKKGDTLVTGATSNVYGYHTELERTMFIGEPSARQAELFKVMLKAQTAALESVKPGKTCADIDKITRNVFKEAGFTNLTRHHTGHGLGMEGHERPFLDFGDPTVLKPGMVFSCEPGIYQIGLGGFRHSDTFVVTKEGAEILTNYPSELSELIL